MDAFFSSPASFRLPDLTTHCRFALTSHPSCDATETASAQWYESGCSDFTDEKRRDLIGLKAGVLAAYVYHDTDDEHLRVICDFMNYIFHLDDLSDGLLTEDTEVLADVVTNALESPHSYRRIAANGRELPADEPDVSKLARDFWARCIQDAGPGFQKRFSENLACYMKAVSTQARDRDHGIIPDLEAYMRSRRGNSGLWPLIDGLEYTLRIDLPDYVIDDPVMRTLKRCVNDFIAWSNDIFSYNAEQARGDTYNMVSVLMKHHHLDLQGAVDNIADMCLQTLNTFCKNQKVLPSWGKRVDEDVARYVQGLESWMVGALHWSFTTERYFGSKVLDIKQSRVIKLIAPRRVPTNAA